VLGVRTGRLGRRRRRRLSGGGQARSKPRQAGRPGRPHDAGLAGRPARRSASGPPQRIPSTRRASALGAGSRRWRGV